MSAWLTSIATAAAIASAAAAFLSWWSGRRSAKAAERAVAVAADSANELRRIEIARDHRDLAPQADLQCVPGQPPQIQIVNRTSRAYRARVWVHDPTRCPRSVTPDVLVARGTAVFFPERTEPVEYPSGAIAWLAVSPSSQVEIRWDPDGWTCCDQGEADGHWPPEIRQLPDDYQYREIIVARYTSE